MDYQHQQPVGGPPPGQYNAPATSGPHNDFMSKERPEVPAWITWLLPPILVLSLGVLGMVGYVVHLTGTGEESLGFNLFAGAWGLIVTTYIFLCFLSVAPHHKWIIFILAVMSCIWWLTAFAWLASNTRQVFQVIELIDSFGSSYSDIYSYYGYDYSSLPSKLAKRQFGSSYYTSVISTLRNTGRVMAGASATGAIIWVLWMVFTVFYTLGLFRGLKTKSSNAAVSPDAIYEPKTNIQPPVPQQQPPSGYPAVPSPVSSPAPAFSPLKPDPSYDPRVQGHFMTPPPPQASPSPAPVYSNPQFSQPANAYEMPVPVQARYEAPTSVAQPHNIAEMPAGR